MAFPRKLIQTFKHIDDIVLQSKLSFLKKNQLEYEFFDDNDCYNFIKKHYDDEILKAYDKIIPKAFKADMFRYCYLYQYGGIYSDIDTINLNNLDFLLNDNTYDIIITRERANIPGLFQAFIISKPKQEIFKIAIDLIVKNVNRNYYPYVTNNQGWGYWVNILAITGPVLLGNSLCKLLELPFFTCNTIYTKNIINEKIKIKFLNFMQNNTLMYENIPIILNKNINYDSKAGLEYMNAFNKRQIYNHNYIMHIGKSNHPIKEINTEDKINNYKTLITNENWCNPFLFPDKFYIEIKDNICKIERMDKKTGWGLDLYIVIPDIYIK